ncbi:MAG: TRAP transporter TatT component family protein [Myxococcales bacterium]|nr:TRAP transporter TatT component family protein [Myxococcales bacterium]MDH3843860.1 TRAP transporter TatT component family protein [Myxococcales bacterium]
MTSSLKFGQWIAFGCMVAVVAGCGSTREGAWETSSETVVLDESAKAQEAQLVAEAKAAWLKRGDEAQSLAAVEKWKQAVAINPKNAEAWTDLSHALFFYADCHLRFDESRADLHKATHEEGTRAAERALVAMSPAFAQRMNNGELIEEAIEVLDASAVPALYWRSSNLGRWATLESFATLLSYKDEVRAIMEFCLDNDPSYWYQGPDRYFGIFYAKAPGFSGGDMTKSMEHFQASIAVHPNYLGTHTFIAEEWAIKEADRALFDQELSYVLNTDPNVIPAISAENACEQRKAKILMADADDLF